MARRKRTTCSKCGNDLEAQRIKKHSYCLKCHREAQKKYRPKYSELSDEQKAKAHCRSISKIYFRRGAIKKTPCCVCGEDSNEMHHADYSKPLEVTWLCYTCHRRVHKMIKIKNLIDRFPHVVNRYIRLGRFK